MRIIAVTDCYGTFPAAPEMYFDPAEAGTEDAWIYNARPESCPPGRYDVLKALLEHWSKEGIVKLARWCRNRAYEHAWSAAADACSACSPRPPPRAGPPRWTTSPPPSGPVSPRCAATWPPCAVRASRPSPGGPASARNDERKVGRAAETSARHSASTLGAVSRRHNEEDVCSGASPTSLLAQSPF